MGANHSAPPPVDMERYEEMGRKIDRDRKIASERRKRKEELIPWRPEE